LKPWDETGITLELVEYATAALANTTHIDEQSWTVNNTEAWDRLVIVPFVRMLPVNYRIQIVGGKLYLEDLHAVRPWRQTTPGRKVALFVLFSPLEYRVTIPFRRGKYCLSSIEEGRSLAFKLRTTPGTIYAEASNILFSCLSDHIPHVCAGPKHPW
jgi:hypothetical protein